MALQSPPKPTTSLRLDHDQTVALDAMAAERRLNRSILIREAIDTYLRLHGRDPRRTREVETAASA